MNATADTASSAKEGEAFCTRCARKRPTEVVGGARRFAWHRTREDGPKCTGSYALAGDTLMATADRV